MAKKPNPFFQKGDAVGKGKGKDKPDDKKGDKKKGGFVPFKKKR